MEDGTGQQQRWPLNLGKYHDLVASLGCVVCRRLGFGYVPAQLHHVAEGSGVRHEHGVVPLCEEHHTGESGFHKRGKGFLKQFRVPGESEYGLLIWLLQDLHRD